MLASILLKDMDGLRKNTCLEQNRTFTLSTVGKIPLGEREKIMFPESFRNQERLIEIKFGEQLRQQHKQDFNRYSGSSTGASHPVTSMIIGIIITFLAIAAFLLIFGFIGFTL